MSILNNIRLSATIRIKLILGFGVLVLLALAIGVIGMQALSGVHERTDKADDANRIVKYVLDLRSEEKNYMLRGKADEAGDVRELLSALGEQIKETKAQFQSVENDALMDRLTGVVDDYSEAFERYVEVDREADTQQAAMELAAREMEQVLTDLRAQQKEQLRNLLSEGATESEEATEAEILEELREADTANRLIKYMLEMRRDEKNF